MRLFTFTRKGRKEVFVGTQFDFECYLCYHGGVFDDVTSYPTEPTEQQMKTLRNFREECVNETIRQRVLNSGVIETSV